MPTVAIDIGHGSNTFPPSKGVYVDGKGYQEHDFNSKVAIELDKLLKAKGVDTVMYQKPFSPEIGLTQRTNYYNAKKVDLVFSIHANANNDEEADGRCVFYWHTSEEGKRMAELYVEEVKKAGYSTHGNGLHASQRGSWTNLHICRETNMPAVLTENGFMTNDEPGKNDDFELIFGSKQDEYVKEIAKVQANAIVRYFGQKATEKPKKVAAPKQKVKSSTSKSKSISQMADEVIAGKHVQGHDKRRSSLGISKSEYEKVRAEVNRRAGVKTSTPKKSSKSISQMAQEVVDDKHGNGHDNRRKSLGISQSDYNNVRAEVNKRASGGTKSSGKSISQMATEVIQGKHGSGHANRRESLGISQSQYEKVRAEVNRRF
ncbi:N-acetylmuramoyl-L-alanine amidase [Oceanobacillus sp. 1P07AA]|uniref:N-acetylmuramoyl-L-alanine amidase n=1 Tax=Oceanobacillus sp. 1P07AA TaxID=3132293 RepID=UPI0039A5685C